MDNGQDVGIWLSKALRYSFSDSFIEAVGELWSQKGLLGSHVAACLFQFPLLYGDYKH